LLAQNVILEIAIHVIVVFASDYFLRKC